VQDLIEKMTDAAKDDDELRKKGRLATKKLKLLPFVVNKLRNVDLHMELMDANILRPIGQWLVPDRFNRLPPMKIRDELIEIVFKFFCTSYDIDYLEESRFGKVLTALKNHKDESAKNKKILQKMYNVWAKNAMKVQDDLTKMSQEQRASVAKETKKKYRRKRTRKSIDEAHRREKAEQEQAKIQIGEEGFIQRARVPQAITQDYTIRPKAKVYVDLDQEESSDVMAALNKKSIKKKTKFDSMQRKLQLKKHGGQKRNHHASNVSLSSNF